jgi:oligopeptide/dipeptide ABC transporter ATP-binding protein
MAGNEEPIVRVRDLRTYFYTDDGVARAVDGVSFDLFRGKTTALVGESGCGKSVTALSLLGLIPQPPGRIESGEITLEGRNLLGLTHKQLRQVRGNDISMIFQEPMTSLNPVFRVGNQISAVVRLHRKLDKKAAMQEAVRLLQEVGIADPEDRVKDFPHQLSGGMRQRVMIAMALACNPKVLIADEPTTALDVTVQAQILELLNKLQQEHGMAVLLITHDLGVVAEVADDVAVMYAGRIVEHAPVNDLFANPSHPYTLGLFKALPDYVPGVTRLHTIEGNVPAATRFPKACRFHPRCPFVMDICRDKEPPFFGPPDHESLCWLHDREVVQEEGRPLGIPEEARRT